MKSTSHEFYNKFECIADKCPDSCCKEWDVVVDDDSYTKYKNAGGEIGDRLRRVMTVDSDGDRIFTLCNNRCPFWNEDMLCDIYIELGEDSLCETCRRFPRIVLDYSAFEEKILSLACPEALRLMLEKGAMQKIATIDNQKNPEPCDYDTEVMVLLINAREDIFTVLNDDKNSIEDCLNKMYKICLEVQSRLDDADYIQQAEISEEGFFSDYKSTVGLLLRLDIMTDEWRILLENAGGYTPDERVFTEFKSIICEYEYEYKNLMYYYTFRYFLNSIDSFDVLKYFDLTLLAVKSAYVLHLYEFSKSHTLLKEQRHRIFGLYSKEVEHSYENIEFLTER